MQQHPVPQNVTSYQFRLIGDMTLKQFLQLLGGGVIAFIFYSTNLISIIKWFFMFIAVIGGVAFAFLPLEGRPLDQWLMAFIRAIYMPTQFYWKKQPKLPDYLTDQPLLKSPPLPPVPQSTPPVVTTSQPNETIEQLEIENSKQLDEILKLYHQVELPQTVPTQVEKEQPVTKIPTNQTDVTAKYETQPIESIQITTPPSTPTPTQPNTTPEPEAAPHPIMVTGTIKPPPASAAPQTPAVFNPNLPFPELPETTNMLVGMVFDNAGKIIENAVIEIKNEQGTVRATKTNRLGQFFLATPLQSESYIVEIEKPGFTFQPISIQLEGKVYPPLEIHASN